MYDIIIIGAGCTGFGAAMYCGRFDLKTLVLGELVGGTITTTHIVENYPGFKSISGFDLAEKLKEHALDYDVDLKEEKVLEVKQENGDFTVKTKKNEYKGKSVLFATGTEWRKLGVPGEKEYANKGVHYCASCDGFAYKEKVVAIVGGSDSAAKEALLLTEYGKKVYIFYRGEEIHPEPINMARVKEKIKEGSIEIINHTNILEIKGDENMTHVVLDKEYNGSKEFKLDGLFIEIGHLPLTNLAKDIGVELDKKSFIKINKNSETNIPGAYAAGDCANTEFKQAIVGVAEGTLAAYAAFQFVKSKDINPT